MTSGSSTGASDRRDSVLIELAIDAAKVTDDFVRSVLQTADGRAGGSEHVERGWRRWFGGGALRGERRVVQIMGAAFAPEQLRKAANEADELVQAIADLADATGAPALDAAARLGALDVRAIPATLRRPDIGSGSRDVRAVHDLLSRVIAVLNEARSQAVLVEMRAARDQAR